MVAWALAWLQALVKNTARAATIPNRTFAYVIEQSPKRQGLGRWRRRPAARRRRLVWGVVGGGGVGRRRLPNRRASPPVAPLVRASSPFCPHVAGAAAGVTGASEFFRDGEGSTTAACGTCRALARADKRAVKILF